MKERPILFNGPMVRAILSGAKTQTRRVVKGSRYRHEINRDGVWFEDEYGDWFKGPCPFGEPGDRLWVRETFTDVSTGDMRAQGHRPVWYRADGSSDADDSLCRWTPSIHMPRWASRISLEVTGVRVERLQEISEADARSEGCPHAPVDQDWSQCRRWFQEQWLSIYGEDSWNANPWVWVIEFKRTSP